jgi:hypothetical protein
MERHIPVIEPAKESAGYLDSGWRFVQLLSGRLEAACFKHRLKSSTSSRSNTEIIVNYFLPTR